MPPRVWLPGSSRRRHKIHSLPTVSETSLVSACLAWLRVQGVMAWRNNTGMAYYDKPGRRPRPVHYGLVGSSDILGCYAGHFIAVEVKRHPNRLTGAQQQFLEEATAHGAWATCVWSVDELETWWRAKTGGR